VICTAANFVRSEFQLIPWANRRFTQCDYENVKMMGFTAQLWREPSSLHKSILMVCNKPRPMYHRLETQLPRHRKNGTIARCDQRDG
jgi:hypothetical protein